MQRPVPLLSVSLALVCACQWSAYDHLGLAADAGEVQTPDAGVVTWPAHCRDGVAGAGETGTDCGGGCPACVNGEACLRDEDCASGRCVDRICAVDDACDGSSFECPEDACGTVPDSCGQPVSCGDCQAPFTCGGEGVPRQCGCSESDVAVCSRLLGCGVFETQDVCGRTRTVDCGGCGEDERCGEDNTCECVGESDEELCTRLSRECGSAQATDACGRTRTLDCGTCAGGTCSPSGTCGGGCPGGWAVETIIQVECSFCQVALSIRRDRLFLAWSEKLADARRIGYFESWKEGAPRLIPIWSGATMGPDVAVWFDSSDQPHLATLVDDSHLLTFQHPTPESTSWAWSTVAGDDGAVLNLFGGDNQAAYEHILFERLGLTNTELVLMSALPFEAYSFHTTPLPQASTAALAVSATGSAHVAYSTGDDHSLVYLRPDSEGGFTREVLGKGVGPSLAVSSTRTLVAAVEPKDGCSSCPVSLVTHDRSMAGAGPGPTSRPPPDSRTPAPGR